MLYTLYSNSYELLERALISRLEAQRKQKWTGGTAAAFSRTTVLTPTAAVRDGLQRAFANQSSVALTTGISFDTLGHWLEPYAGPVLGKGNRGQELEWLIWDALSDKEFLDLPENERLKAAASGKTADGLYRMAIQIAAVFAAYITYRLDWVLEWMGVPEEALGVHDQIRRRREQEVLEASPDYLWQKNLWNRISSKDWNGKKTLEKISGSHREMLEKGLQDANGADEVHIFMPALLPPLALPFIQAMAKHRPISIYVFNPCKELWFESQADDAGKALTYLRRNAASERAMIDRLWSFSEASEADESIYEDDHPLRTDESQIRRHEADSAAKLDLSALNRISAKDVAFADQDMVYVNFGGDSLLHRLQRSVLTDTVSELADGADESDESVRIVKAPGLVREVQSLVDWMLHIIAQSRDTEHPITPQDILVVTPDVDAVAPVLTGVMAALGPGAHIPVNVAGRSELEINQSAQAILAVGDFLASDVTPAGFEELLAYPLTSAVWNVSLSDLSLMCGWLSVAGFRMGLDDEHAKHLAEAANIDVRLIADNTLQSALSRLLLGRLLDDEKRSVFCEALMTMGDEEDWSNERVSRVPQLLDFLVEFEGVLSECRTIDEDRSFSEWKVWTLSMIEKVFPGAHNDDGLKRFIINLNFIEKAVQDSVNDVPMSFAVFWYSLRNQIKSTPTMARASGRVTVADMESFRWVPFRAVAVIGMGEGGSFPGVNRFEEFDLMQATKAVEGGEPLNVKRRGDRDSRANNRNVFLDLVLSARDALYISYDRGTKAGSEFNPSVVVQELEQLLADGMGEDVFESSGIVCDATSSAYAVENFTQRAGILQSHDRRACEAVSEAIKENYQAPESVFVDAALVSSDAMPFVLGTAKFAGMLEKPLKQAQSRLRMGEEYSLEQTVDSLFFPSDNLTKSKIDRALFDAGENGNTEEVVNVFSHDPTLGLADLRKLKIEERLPFINAQLEELAKQRQGEAVSLPEVSVSIKSPAVGTLIAPEQTLWRDEKGLHMIEAVRSGADKLRCFLNYLIRNTTECCCDLTLVGKPEKAGKDPVDPVVYAVPEAPERIPEVLAAMASVIEMELCRKIVLTGARDYIKDADVDSCFIPVFLGQDAQEVAGRSARLTGAFAGLLQTYAPKPEKQRKNAKPIPTVDDFIKAIASIEGDVTKGEE